MIIVEAKVIIYSKYVVGGTSLMSGFRTTMKICDKGYISQLITYQGKDLPLDVETTVEIKILYGEIDVRGIKENVQFEFVAGKIVGKGCITKVKEIYVEKDALESLSDKKLSKEIIEYAKQLDNAIIFDDAYDLISIND
jgi:hypothetical protein